MTWLFRVKINLYGRKCAVDRTLTLYSLTCVHSSHTASLLVPLSTLPEHKTAYVPYSLLIRTEWTQNIGKIIHKHCSGNNIMRDINSG